jgi:uncharacterized membrane protein
MLKRLDLDFLAKEYRLSEPAIELALDLTGNRPDTQAWLKFFGRLLGAAGIGALGAGIVFFVAANWQHYGVLGRFAILQAAFVVCAGIALWRAPPQIVGQAALMLATFLIGGLLALFGQSYQTGADVYELFFTWAALALPFALGGFSGALWAIWWSILNVALALYCGWLSHDHIIWALFDRWGIGKSTLLMAACVVNLAGAGAFLALARSRFGGAAPYWLVRLLAAFAFLYGTAACVVAVTNTGWRTTRSLTMSGQDWTILGLFAAICAVVAIATMRCKRDAFPLALIAGSWIAISTAALIDHIKFDDTGAFFVISMWLIATSTVAGLILMKCVRAWRIGDPQAEVTA